MIQCTIRKTHQNFELLKEKKCSEIIVVFGWFPILWVLTEREACLVILLNSIRLIKNESAQIKNTISLILTLCL